MKERCACGRALTRCPHCGELTCEVCSLCPKPHKGIVSGLILIAALCLSATAWADDVTWVYMTSFSVQTGAGPKRLVLPELGKIRLPQVGWICQIKSDYNDVSNSETITCSRINETVWTSVECWRRQPDSQATSIQLQDRRKKVSVTLELTCNTAALPRGEHP